LFAGVSNPVVPQYWKTWADPIIVVLTFETPRKRMDAEAVHKKRTAAKTQFTRHENRMREALTEEDIDEWTLNKRYGDFKERFDKVQDLNEEYVSFLTADDEIINADKWVDDLVKRFDSIQLLVGRKFNDLKYSESKDKGPGASAVDSASVAEPKQANRGGLMKLKRFELETFTGDIRRYPSFKNDF